MMIHYHEIIMVNNNYGRSFSVGNHWFSTIMLIMLAYPRKKTALFGYSMCSEIAI